MATVKAGDKVRVHYHGRLSNGETFDKSEGRDPLEFEVGNYVDEATGIPVVSLYGAKRLPDANDLKDVDVMIFDIQDVGTRFYTYISSLEDYIQAGIEHKKTVLILDRPNPNGHYVDGPVLQTPYKSFIGRQQIPVVYGLTMAEYAQYLLGEKLIKGMEGKFVPTVIDGAIPNS